MTVFFYRVKGSCPWTNITRPGWTFPHVFLLVFRRLYCVRFTTDNISSLNTNKHRSLKTILSGLEVNKKCKIFVASKVLYWGHLDQAIRRIRSDSFFVKWPNPGISYNPINNDFAIQVKNGSDSAEKHYYVFMKGKIAS